MWVKENKPTNLESLNIKKIWKKNWLKYGCKFSLETESLIDAFVIFLESTPVNRYKSSDNHFKSNFTSIFHFFQINLNNVLVVLDEDKFIETGWLSSW